MKLYSKCLLVVFVAISSLSLAKDSNIFLDIDYRDNKSILKWLKRKPDFNVLNEQGQSVLIKAVQANNSNLVATLIRKGVDVNTIDDCGKTALDYAIESKHKKLVLSLVKKNAMVTTQQNLADVRTMITSKARWLRALSTIFLLPIKVLGIVALVAAPLVIIALPIVGAISAVAAGFTGGAAVMSMSTVYHVAAVTGLVCTTGLAIGLPCHMLSINWYDKQALYNPNLIAYNTAVIRP